MAVFETSALTCIFTRIVLVPHTLRGESGPARQKAEEEYSRRETLAKPVADKIIAAARNNARPGLTLRERLFIHLFHCDTWRRTPDVAAEKDRRMGPFDHDAFLEWYGKERNLNARGIAFARDLLNDPGTQKIINRSQRAWHGSSGSASAGCLQVSWGHGARDCANRKTEQEFRHRQLCSCVREIPRGEPLLAPDIARCRRRAVRFCWIRNTRGTE